MLYIKETVQISLLPMAMVVVVGLMKIEEPMKSLKLQLTKYEPPDIYVLVTIIPQ
jgi:hypothetical protein